MISGNDGLNDERNDPPSLSPEDIAALDRLMEAGLDAPPSPGDPRAGRILGLMSLLGTPVAGEGSDRSTRINLADVRARRVSARPTEPLAELDAAAVDHWMDHPGETPPQAIRERVERVESLAMLATSGPAADADARQDLIERTLEAARKAEADRAGSMRFEEHARPAGGRFRLADLISVAATLLIGASIAIPSMQAVGRHREQAACLTNMQSAARAFGLYAGNNADMLPMATAGFGGSWMDVGTPSRSNSANLYTLPREGYLRLDDFACPTNPLAARGEPAPGSQDWKNIDEISYSYRIMPTGGLRMTLPVTSATMVVVMSDRSPVTLRASKGLKIFPEANTPNHDSRGQHLLRLDGSATWETSPVIEGDNLWLPRPVEQMLHQIRTQLGIIKGTEMPESETDAFVGP